MTDGEESTEVIIDLAIPAHPEFARLARLTAAALARRHGFTYREVEDLRLAVDEAMIALLAPDTPGSNLQIRYTVSTACVEIEFIGLAAAPEDRADRFDTMVAELVDERSLDRTGHDIRLVKRHKDQPAAPTGKAATTPTPSTSPLHGV